MQTIFLVAGVVPVVLAAVAMCAAGCRSDEIANPHRASPAGQTPNSGGSASTMTRPQKKWVSIGASTPPVARRSRRTPCRG